jgi:two-component system NtrC family sensor kinase
LKAAVDPHVSILVQVAETVGRSLDPDEVVGTVLEAITHVTGHEISSLHLLSEDGQWLWLRDDRGLSPRLRDVNRRLPVGQGIIGGVAARGETVRLDDVSVAPELFPPARDAVSTDMIRGFVCVPIRSRGRILGTLSLGRRTDGFDEREVALVQGTAHQVGIALDNARLHSELRRQLEELQQTHLQLVRAAKLSAVGELASGVAHEINNPLTTVLGQTQLLLGQAGLAQAVRERVRIISEESARAARMVQNFLVFARHYPPERRPCTLAEQVRRVLDLKGYQLDRDRIRVQTDVGPCPPVWADENQIQQVLLNLVLNAHQAMAEHPGPRVLTLRVRADDAHAVIEVLDTGPGIPPEALPRIFDPFFTTKPPGLGSGLGLSVSRGIIRDHQGRLHAENRPEGGALFVVELPLGKPAG